MEKSITATDIARLAKERKLPALLEKSWMKSTGAINPVAEIIKMAENKEKGARRAVYGAFAVFFSVCFMTSLTLSISGVEDMTYFDMHGYSIFLQFLEMLVVVVFIIWLLNDPPVKVQERVAEAFLADLNALYEWAIPILGSMPLSLDEEDLRQTAERILIATARRHWELQVATAGDEELMQDIQKGVVMAEFKRKYDTLQRLGLASGGYAKYFTKAKKEWKKEAEKMAGAPT